MKMSYPWGEVKIISLLMMMEVIIVRNGFGSNAPPESNLIKSLSSGTLCHMSMFDHQS